MPIDKINCSFLRTHNGFTHTYEYIFYFSVKYLVFLKYSEKNSNHNLTKKHAICNTFLKKKEKSFEITHHLQYVSINPGNQDNIFSNGVLLDWHIHQEISLWENFTAKSSLNINMLLLSLCALHSIAFYAICNLTQQSIFP